MKVLVTGGRNYADSVRLCAFLAGMNAVRPITHLIHGGCPTGADYIADRWAKANGVELTVFHANWGKFGRSAGPRRNAEMVATNPDIVVACPGGNGTANCVDLAIRAGLDVVECF